MNYEVQRFCFKNPPFFLSGAPRESPRSPDDRLVIDDGSDDVIIVPCQASRTETPPIPQPPPLTHGGNGEKAVRRF